MKDSQVVIAYVPVLHEGYLRLFTKYRGAKLLIAGQSLTSGFRPLAKDLRALSPEIAKTAINALGIFSSIEIIGPSELTRLAASKADLILPDEDFSRDLAARFLLGANIVYDPLFLRWDRRRSDAREEVSPDHVISDTAADIQRMKQAAVAAGLSSDIWRRVGAVIVLANGKILPAGHNQAMPTDNTPWATGDPRGNYTKGANLDLSLFIHAEAAVIAAAARQGIKLAGGSLYVTTFPCPACAKLIAAAGLSKCYYTDGYAVLDGQDILGACGVEILRVKIPPLTGPETNWVPYPTSS